MELRGAAAVVATAFLAVFAATVGAATLWLLSRNPELEPKLRAARRLAGLSVALTLLATLAVLLMVATGTFD